MLILAQAMKSNTSLTMLMLRDCRHMGVEACRKLGEVLKVHQSLHHVRIQWSELSEEEVREWCEGIKENHTLQSLTLEQNHLSPQSLSSLFSVLSSHPSLSHLYIEESTLQDAAIQAMAEMIKVRERQHAYVC